ncbi:hypothetical protein DYB32_005193 [Aphanomyces invadans]|uniref:Hexosyltransferase n=2 Tax=Aphanomyces invadans TaxID=157072 RepID=A0A418AV86_9STRA|nr:hypothetical protein DYB32_005193 [Aphanomyces invadans]
MPPSMPRYAYATLVTTDAYVVGAAVLRASLLAAKSPALENVELYPVALLYPRDDQATSYAFERFKDVWTKLRVFELTQYDTVTFLDSDMLCTQNMDELFTTIGDAPDSLVASLACICNPSKQAHYPKHWEPKNCPYWQRENGHSIDANAPKYFNSGMFVLHPSIATFNRLVTSFQDEVDLSRFIFPDQCFLNEMFPDFQVVSYKYNAVKTLRTAHPKTWDIQEVKNLHFILTKPWNVDPSDPAQIDPFFDLYEFWWAARDDAAAVASLSSKGSRP